ncbi:UPF0104 family protein [Chthonobacter rhizosphaerae]|uniref:UPF0104 family protein n=1 Tax=Chthonobacter rhizosphaerae TaxID=2735553 RepID=UPI0015EECA2D|nr:UPF0104 family protein [Chthonobacter rhizosphaerae]
MLQPVDEKPDARSVEAGSVHRLIRWAGPVVAIGLIVSASFVLWQMITSMSYADVERAILTMSPWRIAASFLFTGLGLVSLACYDLIAVQVISRKPVLSNRRAALGSLIANIFANVLGLPLLSGGSARYRIYSMVGAGLSVVGRLIAMSWMTMWSGIVAVLGFSLALEPGRAEAVFGHHAVDRLIGVVLILLVVGFVVWVGSKRRAVRLGGWTVRLPNAWMAVGMIAVGAVDLVAAAAALWVLLPADAAPDLARYIVAYSVGLIAGIASNTPGGIGVFEAALVTGLGIAERPDVAAALILFRMIYFVVPLVLALALLGAIEVRHRRQTRERIAFGDDYAD